MAHRPLSQFELKTILKENAKTQKLWPAFGRDYLGRCTFLIVLLLCCSHSAGDVLMVQPSNLPDVVQEFIDHLALTPDQLFRLEQNDPGKFFKLLV